MPLRKFPLTAFCIALIWYLCLFKPPSISIGTFAGFDKVVHFTMYAGTCGVFWGEYFRARLHSALPRLLLVSVVAPVLMSGIIELVQEYCTTYRGGDWLDFAANSAGVLAAAAGAAIFCKVTGRKMH